MIRISSLTALVVVCCGAQACQMVAGGQPVDPHNRPIVFEANNGGPGFRAHERLTLTSDGHVTYTSDGPMEFDWKTQNRVGDFAATVEAAAYSRLAAMLARALPAAPKNVRLPSDAGAETIAFDPQDGLALVRMHGAAAQDSFGTEFGRLKDLARAKPVRAAELSCGATASGGLDCRLQSVGSSAVIAPRLGAGQFFCFTRQSHMEPLAPPAGMPPFGAPAVEITPGQALEFRFAVSPCDFHLILNFDSYGGGSLISNELAR